MLWYLGITLTPTSVASFSSRPEAVIALLVFAGLGVVSFLGAYWWLLIKHPDRLQSEDYMKHLLGDDRSGKRALDERPEPPGIPLPTEPVPPPMP
jgi:hypothetical protein